MTVNDVIQAAMQLTEPERAEVVDVLRSTLPAEPLDAYDEQWREELQKRSEALDKDPASAVSWEEARAEAWRRATGA